MPTVAANAFDVLNADWAALCASPQAAARVTDWLAEAAVLTPGGVPRDLGEMLVELERGDRAQGREHSDRWLRVLLRRAADGEQLAARVVVQAMLPSAVRTVRALLSYGLGWNDTAAIVVGALYELVLSYPLERRPARIAANLAMTCRQRARWAVAAEARPGAVVPVPLEELWDTQQPVDPSLRPCEHSELAELLVQAAEWGLADGEGLVDQLAGARGELVELLLWALREEVLGPQEVTALHTHYQEQAVADEDAAAAAGISAVAVRKRRSRAVRRLRDAAPRWQREQCGMAQAA